MVEFPPKFEQGFRGKVMLPADKFNSGYFNMFTSASSKNSPPNHQHQLQGYNPLNYFQHQGVTTRSQAHFFHSKANLIKHCFKVFARSRSNPQLNLVDFPTKKIIEAEMIKLNRIIKNSNSAIMTNMEASNDIVYIQTCEDDLEAHPEYRPQQISHIINRNRGFIGNLLQY